MKPHLDFGTIVFPFVNSLIVFLPRKADFIEDAPAVPPLTLSGLWLDLRYVYSGDAKSDCSILC